MAKYKYCCFKNALFPSPKALVTIEKIAFKPSRIYSLHNVIFILLLIWWIIEIKHCSTDSKKKCIINTNRHAELIVQSDTCYALVKLLDAKWKSYSTIFWSALFVIPFWAEFNLNGIMGWMNNLFFIEFEGEFFILDFHIEILH